MIDVLMDQSLKNQYEFMISLLHMQIMVNRIIHTG